MRHLLIVLSVCLGSTAFAQAKLSHAKLVEKYEETSTWANRSNFYFGARGGIAIPPGAIGLAPSAGVELGIAPDYGFGMGLNVIWMNKPPGVPVFGIQPADYGFGASVNFRYYIQTIGPLTLYPSMSVGFLAGPGPDGRNQVLPLFNPGVGAKVKPTRRPSGFVRYTRVPVRNGFAPNRSPVSASLGFSRTVSRMRGSANARCQPKPKSPDWLASSVS